MEYLVEAEKGKLERDGAYVPDFPVCVWRRLIHVAKSKLIREAITLHIEALREAGQSVPEPNSKSEVVKVSRPRNRWSGRVPDKVPSSYVGARAAQLNR